MTNKKVILFAILAIAIGAATIIPLEYLMTGQATANAQITPWHDVTISYAYVNLHDSGGNNTMKWDGANIQAIANFTLTPDAITLKSADAQIEFYQFRVYTDQQSIVNITYSTAVAREEIKVPGMAGGCYMAITGSGANKYTFADGTTFDGTAVVGDTTCGGGVVQYIMPNEPDMPPIQNSTKAAVGTNLANYNGENTNQALTELRSAQTLYIDVSRIFSVAYHGNATSSTSATVTQASNEVLQHIELTKTDSGFVYGEYKQGTVPFPVQTP